MQPTSVAIVPQPRGTISPRLYGHFAEHLGRCCYDGLWVGVDSAIPNVDGFRTDAVAALREAGVGLLRWPGGCFADHYHWRDGVGASRPKRLGTSCGLRSVEDNALGTHEFLRLCELIGAEPYLAGNVGTGTPQELLDWIEYVNGGLLTANVEERVRSGRTNPWGVRLWGIGNESWDCGGRFDPASYGREFRRYATLARHVDPTVELVAVGLEDGWRHGTETERDWNRIVLETLGESIDLVDHLSIHRYFVHGGPAIDFDEAAFYALLAEVEGTSPLIERAARTIADLSPRKRIGIALDEWGVWHPEARDWGPDSRPVDERCRADPTFEQPNTMRDALAAAVALEVFHRHCDVLSMANLAQVANVLQALLVTDGASVVRTPTFHVFEMSRVHAGAQAVETEVDGPCRLPDGSAAVTATSSMSGDGAAITLVNRHLLEPSEVRLDTGGRTLARARLLAAEAANAVNSNHTPDAVTTRPLDVDRRREWIQFLLPAHSVATIEFVAPGTATTDIRATGAYSAQ